MLHRCSKQVNELKEKLKVCEMENPAQETELPPPSSSEQ